MNPSLKLAHISDLHVGTVEDAQLDRLADDVHAQHPQFIICTGDLTQWGKSKEFARARRFLDSLPGRVIIIPGNHDISALNPLERFVRPYYRFKRSMEAPIEPVYLDNDLCVVGLNSARRILARMNWSHGVISLPQLQHLRDVMETAPLRALRVLAMHHPVTGTPGARAGEAVMRSEQLLGTASEVHCDLVLTGHGHRHGARVLSGEPMTRSLVAVAAGSAVSPRLRDAENSYAVISYDGALFVDQRVLRDGAWQSGGGDRFERTPKGWSAITK